MNDLATIESIAKARTLKYTTQHVERNWKEFPLALAGDTILSFEHGASLVFDPSGQLKAGIR